MSGESGVLVPPFQVVRSQEKELEQKDKVIKELKAMNQPGVADEEKADLEIKVKELSDMVTGQAAKLYEYKQARRSPPSPCTGRPPIKAPLTVTLYAYHQVTLTPP